MVLLGYNGFSIYGRISGKIWGQSFGFLDLSAFFLVNAIKRDWNLVSKPNLAQ